MIPYLFHICGPVYANCYGLAILIGILTLLYFAKKDRVLTKLATLDQLVNAIFWSTIVGIIGGALLWGITNWQDLTSFWEIFEIWRGGFSILGTIITIVLFLPAYLAWHKIPVLKFLDRIAIYAPLTHSISRVGCFFAGCCHGIETTSILGVTYTHPDSLAPHGICVHPAQLYSSMLLLLIFGFMYFFGQRMFKKDGQLLSFYLILAGLERFFIDFLRADKEYFSFQTSKIISSNQLIALIIVLVSFILFLYYSCNRENNYKHKT